jgi:hypothetical protein
MNRPTRSQSLAELWGRRWNSGFHDLARQTIFDPITRACGVTCATAAVFIVSGLIHDLIISLPARGGFGGPTLYFIAQLTGLLVQRTHTAKRIGLHRGVRGRFFTAATALLPLPLIFHEPFVRNVMIPFLHALHVM